VRTKVLANATKHGIGEHDVAYAWSTQIRSRQRHGADDPEIWIAIGVLPDGRLAELVGFRLEDGGWCVFHANTPPTKKFLKELGLEGGKHGSD
jgi:hypothetical protein